MGRADHTIAQTLQRIVILLFSLAGLADQAAHASADRRRRALAFIYRGEQAAWGLLADELPGDTPGTRFESSGLADSIHIDDSPEAALLLAARLRLLGWMIANIALTIEPSETPGPGASQPTSLQKPCSLAVPPSATAIAHQAYHDTS